MSLVHNNKNRGDKSDYLAAIKENSSYINTHYGNYVSSNSVGQISKLWTQYSTKLSKNVEVAKCGALFMFLIPWPQFCWIQSLKRNGEGRNWYPWGGRRGINFSKPPEFNMEVIKTPAMQPGWQTYQILIVFFFYLIFDFIDVSSDSS